MTIDEKYVKKLKIKQTFLSGFQNDNQESTEKKSRKKWAFH